MDGDLNGSCNFIEGDELNISLQNMQSNPIALSIKKFISQPNPLMSKVQFSSYVPHQHYRVNFERLPIILKVQSNCVQIEKNNMQAIQESVFGHDRMKKDVMKVIMAKEKLKEICGKGLLTLEEFYQGKVLIYDKFGKGDCNWHHTSQGQSRPPTRNFATYMMDITSITKKQPQKCNTASLSSTARNPIIRRNPSVHDKQVTSHPIIFRSNFQSGNLFRTYQRNPYQYDLILQNDINTKGNNQWFFFSVKGVSKNTTIKFNIVNLNKRRSLFEEGMRPTVFSMGRFERRGVGWVREGVEVGYDENQEVNREGGRPYYRLTFSYKFLYEGDTVYFSHSYPYTVTDLSNFLAINLQNIGIHKLVKLKHIANTLGGNEVDMLEITDEGEVRASAKRVIWVMGRQHPGQVTGSFMMEGIIEYLLSTNQDAKYLLRNFIWKLVPMVNVDGVIHGNTRAQIIGSDPNRKWQNPHKLYNPIIHTLRKCIQKDKGRIQMILDLHSHSRKLGTFFYGNTMQSSEQTICFNKRNIPRIFPMMVCKRDQRFRLDECRFGGGSNRAARRVLFEKLDVPMVYTVESSFYGYIKDEFRIVPYYPKDYKQMANSLLKVFAQYEKQKMAVNINPEILITRDKTNLTPTKEDSQDLMKDLIGRLDKQMQQQLEKDSDGSDSNPSEDQFSEKELKKLLPKTFDIKKKSKKGASKVNKKIVQKKDSKEDDNQQIKIKKVQKDSHYKKYFSSRNSHTDGMFQLQSIDRPKQLLHFGIQVDITQEGGALRQSNSSHTEKRLIGSVNGSGTLCIFGKKLQEEMSIFGTTVGVQVDQKRDLFKTRNQIGSALRRSFKLPCRSSSIFQIKENNFLNRGICGQLTTHHNFFNMKR